MKYKRYDVTKNLYYVYIPKPRKKDVRFLQFIDQCNKIVRKTLKEGSLPLLNMGRNPSHGSTNKRRKLSIVKEHITNENVNKSRLRNLDDLRKTIPNLTTLETWNIELNYQGQILLTYFSPNYHTCVPYFRLLIDDGLGFTIQVLHWFLPEDHCLYVANKRSIRNISVANLVKTCLHFDLCKGVNIKDNIQSLINHCVPKSNTAMEDCQDDEKALVPFENICFKRSRSCLMLIDNIEGTAQCIECLNAESKSKTKLMNIEKKVTCQ